MNTTVFLNIITVAGIGYMLYRNIKLFKVMKGGILKHSLDDHNVKNSLKNLKSGKFILNKNKLHFQEHLIISIFIFAAGFLGIFGLLTGNSEYSDMLTSSIILDTIINTLPYVIIGFVCDHLYKEEVGEYKYDNCGECPNSMKSIDSIDYNKEDIV